jgi:hypothetical protein
LRRPGRTNLSLPPSRFELGEAFRSVCREEQFAIIGIAMG